MTWLRSLFQATTCTRVAGPAFLTMQSAWIADVSAVRATAFFGTSLGCRSVFDLRSK